MLLRIAHDISKIMEREKLCLQRFSEVFDLSISAYLERAILNETIHGYHGHEFRLMSYGILHILQVHAEEATSPACQGPPCPY